MTLLLLIGILVASLFLFMHQPVFGNDPRGALLEKMKRSANYRKGSFANLNETPMMAPNVSYPKMMWNFFFGKPSNTEPDKKLPTVRTDLKSLGEEPVVIWFGHSSYFIRTNGKNFLIDPVFAGNASPVSFFAKSFSGSDAYNVDDFPTLDAVFVTHDHYDHLDYRTIVGLAEKVNHFYTALGVGSHLRHWGIEESKITELDWYEGVVIADGIQLTAAPARHFSGRGFARFKTLWVSYILRTPTHNLYLGGDSGYDDHFKKIGEKYGPFDIAFLECGQYNEQWPFIHMLPEETVRASVDLQAKVLMPVHWGKFSLSMHAWNEPIDRASREAEKLNVRLTTPKIGEPVLLNGAMPNEKWWETIS